ncbi:MAG: hypothetical protein AB7O21_13870 [Gammaproteobacteria bacterium]
MTADWRADVRAAVRSDPRGAFSVGCVDWYGRLRTKQLHGAQLDKVLADGTAFTTAIFATDSAEVPMDDGVFQDPAAGFRDGRVVFDAASPYRDMCPSGPPGMLLLGQFAEPLAPFCPRALLARECDRLASHGLLVRGAFEVECHVLRETPDALAGKVPGLLTSHPEFARMYGHVGHARGAPLFDALRRACDGSGVTLASLHAEYGGLLEAGLTPALGVAAADRLTLYKTFTKIIAREHGALAVFMARLSDRHEPAGGHLNLSLVDATDGAPCFAANGGHMLEEFLGGLQRYAPELFLLYAPHVNSFKRFGGAPFVPITNTWGVDNKTAAFRVVRATPAETRIEVRLPGADVQPHLALAATLAAGRRGLEERLQPTAPVTGDARAPTAVRGAAFPADFGAAISRWRDSACAREVFGAAFVDAFARSREWQLREFARAVTDWELRQFGECV